MATPTWEFPTGSITSYYFWNLSEYSVMAQQSIHRSSPLNSEPKVLHEKHHFAAMVLSCLGDLHSYL